MFEDKKRAVWAVVDSITCEVSSWMLTNIAFKGCSLNDMVREWITCISILPPCERKFKVNFDGASFGNLGMAGFGCVMRYVMRDLHGCIILVKGGLLGICDANYAEIIGFLEALRMLNSGGYNGCFVEGDSMNALE